ncbi:activator-dependent family glycosyltransferase [Herbidospora yilanensis]|uniref:activator-dependent family glycosyltransferase n=1 Tax=Herbidospora yilanensis TaxID=354426 RepID=UPI000783C936|nr:activator-dependent family glycosyltransferase [Herbidospora yilanensis]
MRVLITTYPERTHFLLMVPLAWALRTAGHEVRVAVQPKFADVVTQAGLTAVPVGGDRDLWQVIGRVRNLPRQDRSFSGDREPGYPSPYDAFERDPADLTWEDLRDGYERQISGWHKVSNVPMVAGLVDFARRWKPDLVIWEPTTFAGAVAARACGAAHARLLIGADVYGIAREHFLRLKDGRADPLAEWLGSYARKYGFTPGEDLVTGDFTLDVLPAPLRVQARDLTYVPVRYTQYGGPASVPAWLRTPPERPRVALTMGLTITEHDVGYPVDMQGLLDSLADLDIELVATIPDAEREKLERVPANARLVPYVPLPDLVPTCSAVIHHGGVGTMVTTAQFGVPQLSLPWDVDQPALSTLLAAAGAGLTMHSTTATGPAVRDAVRRLLTEPSFAEGAARLRAEALSVPAPNQVVPRLEELAARHGRG